MMTMVDYWMDAFMAAETEEEEIAIVDAEFALWQAYEEDEIDLERWCEENGVDYYATDDKGILFITYWCWDMCGD